MRYTPQIIEEIYKEISSSKFVLIFITQKFMSKVNGMDGNNDLCKLEYEYILKHKSRQIILLVIEKRMTDVSTWKGQLR
jgi:hypothetical protein